MTNKLLNELTIKIERVTKDFKLLEAELRLLRDWRDTWLTERELLYKRNDELRSVMAKIADMTRKTVFDQLLNKD